MRYHLRTMHFFHTFVGGAVGVALECFTLMTVILTVKYNGFLVWFIYCFIVYHNFM